VSHDREGRQDTLSLEFDLLNLFSWGRAMPLYVIKVVEKKRTGSSVANFPNQENANSNDSR
jgi:hypothetical protein